MGFFHQKIQINIQTYLKIHIPTYISLYMLVSFLKTKIQMQTLATAEAAVVKQVDHIAEKLTENTWTFCHSGTKCYIFTDFF